MTQFAPSQIPSWCTTFEQLLAWAALALNNQYPGLTTIQSLDANGKQLKTRVITADTFFQTATQTDTTPGSWRLILYGSLPLNANFQSAGSLAKNVGSFGDNQVPAGFGGT